MLSVTASRLIALAVSSICYGMFTVLFFATVWVLFKRASTAGTHYTFLGAVILMWLLSTANEAIIIHRALTAFIDYADAPMGGPLAFYNQYMSPSNTAENAVYYLQTLIGDAIVIYRLFVVYNRRVVSAILPAILYTGTIVTGFGVCYIFARTPPSANVFVDVLNPWLTAWFVMTMSTNILCSLAIAYRVITVQRAARTMSWASISPSVIVLVESAAVIALTVMTTTILYEIGENATYIPYEATIPIIGMTFSLIIVRIGLGATFLSTTTNGNTSTFNRKSVANVRGTDYNASQNNELSHSNKSEYALKALEINIRKTVETDNEDFKRQNVV